jgi:hypothetical protein
MNCDLLNRINPTYKTIGGGTSPDEDEDDGFNEDDGYVDPDDDEDYDEQDDDYPAEQEILDDEDRHNLRDLAVQLNKLKNEYDIN